MEYWSGGVMGWEVQKGQWGWAVPRLPPPARNKFKVQSCEAEGGDGAEFENKRLKTSFCSGHPPAFTSLRRGRAGAASGGGKGWTPNETKHLTPSLSPLLRRAEREKTMAVETSNTEHRLSKSPPHYFGGYVD